MPSIRIVLVEPKNEGNVGAIARVMKNFGVEDLVLVRPCPLGAEARQRAMHGVDVLGSARTVPDIEEATADVDLLVATSGVETSNEKRFARISIPPRDLAARTSAMKGRVGILFGREDFGLRDEDIRACDLLVTIPASKSYPILNVSHAAAILLYELHAGRGNASSGSNATGNSPGEADAERTVRLLHAPAAVLLELKQRADRVDVLGDDVGLLVDRLEVVEPLSVDDVDAVAPDRDLVEVGPVP